MSLTFTTNVSFVGIPVMISVLDMQWKGFEFGFESGHVVYTHASDSKQYNMILANAQFCSWEGNGRV